MSKGGAVEADAAKGCCASICGRKQGALPWPAACPTLNPTSASSGRATPPHPVPPTSQDRPRPASNNRTFCFSRTCHLADQRRLDPQHRRLHLRHFLSCSNTHGRVRCTVLYRRFVPCTSTLPAQLLRECGLFRALGRCACCACCARWARSRTHLPQPAAPPTQPGTLPSVPLPAPSAGCRAGWAPLRPRSCSSGSGARGQGVASLLRRCGKPG